MSQPQQPPKHDYPPDVHAAGPDAMHAYDALLARLHAANGTAGPVQAFPEEIALILARLGKGPWPDMSHVVKYDEPTVRGAA
jgi:hypothetical protein